MKIFIFSDVWSLSSTNSESEIQLLFLFCITVMKEWQNLSRVYFHKLSFLVLGVFLSFSRLKCEVELSGVMKTHETPSKQNTSCPLCEHALFIKHHKQSWHITSVFVQPFSNFLTPRTPNMMSLLSIIQNLWYYHKTTYWKESTFLLSYVSQTFSGDP